ncbi:hypothetical protein JCM10908_005668 [Rhodotorula pacifica]|uniref:uncharacterized protein n=1 Tax=Rhodotorula pacifica TaxID=1495444 RepID=UPI00317F0C70
MSAFEPQAATSGSSVRYRIFRGGFFRPKEGKPVKLPAPPRPADVDRYHAVHFRGQSPNRPVARGKYHLDYAHKVAEGMQKNDTDYLKKLADDLNTHEANANPDKLRNMLHVEFYKLFRPRLEAFFDTHLPTDEANRHREGEVLTEKQYELIADERDKRIGLVESALADAWCRYSIEETNHKIAFNNRLANDIWAAGRYSRVEDLSNHGKDMLEIEYELDYWVLFRHELNRGFASKKRKYGVKAEYDACHKAVGDHLRTSESSIAVHLDLGKEGLRQPIDETRYWVAFALSCLRPRAHYGSRWHDELAEFLRLAQTEKPQDAASVRRLLEKFPDLAHFSETRWEKYFPSSAAVLHVGTQTSATSSSPGRAAGSGESGETIAAAQSSSPPSSPFLDGLQGPPLSHAAPPHVAAGTHHWTEPPPGDRRRSHA